MRYPTTRILLATALTCTLLLSGRGQAQQPVPGRALQVNGVQLHYRTLGAGDPLLLLHGFGGCGDNWDPFVAELSSQYRLIIPDLRGHGLSTGPNGTFTHAQAAQDIVALLDSLGIGPVKAMGISTGGMALLHAATSHPERIEAMVLIGATSHFPESARVIFRDVATNGISIPEVVEHFNHCAKRGATQAQELLRQFGAFKDSYDDMDFTADELARIQARTLIVHGDRDEFFPVDIPVAMYQGIESSALWIVANGDHVPIYGWRTPHFLDVALRFLGAAAAAHGTPAPPPAGGVR